MFINILSDTAGHADMIFCDVKYHYNYSHSVYIIYFSVMRGC